MKDAARNRARTDAIFGKRREMVKSLERGAKKRHHNPVDSICRKIKSIQMMDQVSNPALQIPKFQSRNFDSPQSNTKKNLEEILKGRTCRSWESTCSPLVSPDSDSVFAANSPGLGATSDSCSAQTTFSILKSSERPSSSWMPPCPMESSSPYCFGPREANAQKKSCALANAEPKDVRPKQKHLTSSPNVYFFTSEKKVESAVVQPPVPKTFPSSERGKVAVSKIIDYLRHTTSRESEDSGLEELCNMLDPEHKDISMDLETYHAIMGEWIEDCKRKCQKTHVWMNVTSGSLEAFGGDVSKGDMETSDLITCIADLQYNNQKLQEENSKLKLTLEAVDETNSKLLADNEHLHQQLKSIQHSVLKAKSLEEELEEARNNLNLSEEKREQILWQNKQLIIRNSMDTNGLQKKILELSKNAAQLQIQAHIYESTVVNKEASLIQKEQDIKELRLTIVECSSVIEIIRTEWTSLDETLDREVLLLLQGPEYAGEKFKTIMQNLQEEVSEAEELVTASLERENDPNEGMPQAWERKLLVSESLSEAFSEMMGLCKNFRQREMETARQLQEETAGQAEALRLELQKATKQLEDASKHAEDQVEAFHSACEEAASLKSKLEEAISEQQKLRDVNAALASTCQLLQEKVEDHKNALTLETSCPNNPPGHSWNQPCRQSSGRCTLEKCDVGHMSSSDVTSGECRWKICSADDYTDADLPVSIAMMDSSLAEVRSCVNSKSFIKNLYHVDEYLKGFCFGSDHLTSAREALAPSVESTAPVPGCLVMEQRTSKGLHERGEDVSTSAATETNSDKDPAAPVSGPGQIKKESCLVMEEHEPVFQSVLKQDQVREDQELGQEKKSNKEQSEEAPAVVPSRKGSSPTAGGIKGDKTKQNEPDSPNEKEVEAEFLRLSLGFKCDLFTLDKRVKLEERSRDLAEENLKKEITNAVNMLEALVPLCEEDNQAQEIIKKLQKSLQFLSQYAARVASRAEMLGAINQESRVSKAVEVMIQHVENLKRMYAKEHAELEELKQVLLQNERSFSCLGDRDESMNKKLPSPFNFKPSSALRRVSIATVPRSAGNAGTGVPLRFLSTYSWAEYEEEHFETKNEQLESPAEVQEQPTRKESVSEKGKYSSKWTLESMYSLMSVWTSHFKASFCNANKTLWVSVSILVLLAALTSFLTGLSLQRPADAAPVGTGDSWTSVQQLLWPYTGLQHNGPPPV
ncbi:hypothetical protein DUI87_20036 [Hirundo rustica rustica]|uniref:Lymphoid-restricted membrane protein n=1 Tax=Hirundo rustica rustica TaxID=333673 RepID=A0A3M0JQ40_HIRRU|nr:hypothetical protein DUI87_20036 [Hirundo rustica rustica]